MITEYSCIFYESYCSFEYYLQAEKTDVFNEYKDHMETLLDLFEDSYLLWKKDILEKAFLNKTKFVYEKFISNLPKDSLIKDSSILIDIRYFEVFMLKYNDCKYIDWDLISEVEYYPWNVQIIERSIQLNWYKLLENKTTRKIILDSENKEKFQNKLHDFSLHLSNIERSLNMVENKKSLFFIANTNGIISEKYRIQRNINQYIKDHLPRIGIVKWLESSIYSDDIMIREKLMIDIYNIS
ncbi:hypothetical protein [Chryseobacterium mucoviscidosis]|uniref:hypothetical protein n=1 Tax=Chryseobacterium mucoviscidosis TaxID=1945581 RepID=UPI003019E264